LTSAGLGQSPSRGDELPSLRLEVLVEPREAPVGAATTVELILSNQAAGTVTVNARLLITPDGGLGEILLGAEGPDGYANEAGFRVRAGAPEAGDFVDLHPAEEIRRRWPLGRYQSMHLPGDYRLQATYHNEIACAPDGRPVITGEYLASCAFRRIPSGTSDTGHGETAR
jgi:hypothetical protein